MSRFRVRVVLAAVVGAASLGTACAQIIGADFNVTLGSTSGSAGGSTGTSTSTGGAGGDAGPDDAIGPDVGPGSGGAGGGPQCDVSPCPPETVAPSEDRPWGLVVQGEWVYWTNAGVSFYPGPPTNDGAIRRVSTKGGVAETVLGQLVAPDQIATDGTSLFWTSSVNGFGAVYRCLISKCIKEDVALAQDLPTGIAVHGGFVYWTTSGDGKVHRRHLDPTLDAGSDMDADLTGFSQPNLIAVDTDRVFISEFVSNGYVWRIGDNLVAAPTKNTIDTSTGIVVLGTNVCYTTFLPSGGVQCIDRGSLLDTITPATMQAYPAGLATDGQALYWVNAGPPGQVMRWRPGQKPVEIASNPLSPNGIVVADKWVYWTNFSLGGSVMRTLKD